MPGPGNILVVDDAPEVTSLVEAALARDGHTVAVAHCGQDAIDISQETRPDLVVLDVGLPDIDGIDVAQELRRTVDPLILFLSARASEADRISGLAAGGDDYVTKPFSPAEIALRVKALLRRRTPSAVAAAESDRISVGSLDVLPLLREVRKDGEVVPLTPIEYGIMELLVRHPRQALERGQIMEAVWGSNWYGVRNVLDGHVSNLRRKLGDDPAAPRFIVAVRGVGYRLGACTND